MGDYNDILNDSEKLGGNRANMAKAMAYSDCMSFCNMNDLRFFGPIFTWTNRRNVNGLIHTSFDRCWANPSWTIDYLEANVAHLPRLSSNHCPLLLSLSRMDHNKLQQPFKFEKRWLSHPGFPTIVERAWDQASSLDQSISSFTTLAVTWNKEVFGNLFARNKKILAYLNGVQKAIATRPSTFLLSLDQELSQEYTKILNQEKDFWALKSHLDWQIHGDRNTTFFHVKTITRRRYNRIDHLKNHHGDWLTNEQHVIEHILKGFQDLYQSQHTTSITHSDFKIDWVVALTEEESFLLSSDVSSPKIKSVIFSLKPFKAQELMAYMRGFFSTFSQLLSTRSLWK